MEQEQFVFFWGHERGDYRCFSQWYPCNIYLNDVAFDCAEQAMMFSKARMFQDFEIADQIMKTNNPSRQKRLGRKVKNFDDENWKRVARRIVYVINMAKFTQNPACLDVILQTQGTLVEASPYDKLWGIGLSANEPRALDRNKWLGFNWLGEVLTEVRNNIQQGKLIQTLCLPF